MAARILSAEFKHETNTFSRIPTDEQAFRDCFLLRGDQAITERGAQNTELAGFIDSSREYGWQLDHVLSAGAGPSGRVTNEAFELLVGTIVEAARSRACDGIILGLHGAMVSEEFDDGEGELLRRLRLLTGDDIPIAITLDLHANVTRRMCELADIIVSYKTYPHIDMRTRGRQAGDILHRSVEGEIRPRSIRVSCPMLEEINGGRTDIGPMIDRLEAARQWEQREDAFAVNINAGFANADIAEAGPTVVVTAQGDMQTHREFARGIARDIWNHRHDVLFDYLDVEQAAARARAFDSAVGPLVIADYADNPGGGAYGDATDLLRALLNHGVTGACFGPIVDRETARQLHRHAPGDRIQVSLGGKTDPAFGGPPLELEVILRSTSEGHYVGAGAMIGGLKRSFGPTAVIDVASIEVLVVSIAQQLLDLQQFRSFGIEPTAKKVVALKSMQHFRADFESIAGEIIVCDSGALCTPHYQRLPYRQVRRPVFPLDADLGDEEAVFDA